MSEPSLMTILDRERPGLESALDARDPTEALASLRAFLDRLPDEHGADDHGRVRDAVEAVRAGLAAAEAVVLVEPEPHEPHEPPEEPSPRRGRWRRASRETAEAFREGLYGEEPPQPLPRPRLEIDGRRLLGALEEALEAADRALEPEPEPPPEPPAEKRWADDPGLVALLQDLLSAHGRGNAEELLRRVSLLEEELRLQHDVSAVVFDGSNEALFAFHTHPDPSESRATTRRPALVAGGTLLRRGEVRAPADQLTEKQGRTRSWPELPTP